MFGGPFSRIRVQVHQLCVSLLQCDLMSFRKVMPSLALFLVVRDLLLVLFLTSVEPVCSGFELFVDWLSLPLGFADTLQFSVECLTTE